MLPQTPVSAVNSVSPAIEWTKRAMFRPFQWAKWWRIGLLGAAIGELGGFSCNFNTGNWDEILRKHPQQFQAAASPFPPELWGSIFLSVFLGIVVLVFVHLYVASVLRFAYFDAVATGRFRLRDGWKRWHSHGLRWFGFSLLLMLAFITFALVVFVPCILIGAGIYKSMGGVGLAIVLLIGIPFGIAFFVALACIGVLTKDFAIPIMALEEVTAFAAFKRVLQNAWTKKGQHAGYLGIKLVLAIAFAITATIIEGMLLVIFIVPVVLIIVATGVFSSVHGMDPQRFLANPMLIAALVTGIVVIVFALMAIAAIVLSPGLFFFEAYVLTWLAQRYEPLWNLLYPAPPQPPPSPEPVISPEPPPLPAL